MLNVKFKKKQKTLNESLQASGQYLLLEGLVDDVLKPLLKKYEDSANDLKMLKDLGEWPEITPGPKKPNVKDLSGPEKAEAFREFNRLNKETKEKNKPKQEEIDRKVKLIKWANLMYGEGPKDHPPREALPVVQDFLNKLPTMRDKYKSNEDFKKKVDELSSGTSNDPLDIDQFTSDDMREIIESIEVQVGDIVPDKEQARKDKIGETENWEVFLPSTVASSCALGKGTTWCTSRVRGDNFFNHYVATPDSDIVLFYVIKKNAGTPPKEHPQDYLSLGYYENGEKVDDYEYGGVNIDSDNNGVEPEEFASIVGEEESKEVYRIIDERFKTFTEHPMKEKLREAGQDLETFNSLFTKGMSYEMMHNLIEDIIEFGPLSPQVQLAVREKVPEIIKKRKSSKSLRSPKFENLQLPELSLGFDADLTGINFSESNLEKSNFENAKISTVAFTDANLEKCNFTGTTGINTSFIRANLKDAVFLNADLSRAKFSMAKLENTNLEGARIVKGEFTKASLVGANLKGADLSNSVLKEASFKEVNLQGANLERTVASAPAGFDVGPLFLKCNLGRTNFKRSILDALKLNSSNLEGSSFHKARFVNANIQRSTFGVSEFVDASIVGSDIILTDFYKGFFMSFSFYKCRIKESNFRGSTFSEPSFLQVTLQEVAFQGVNFDNGVFEDVNVEGGNFEGANFTRMSFLNTNFEKANLNGARFDRCAYYPDTKFPEGFNPEERGLVRADPEQDPWENPWENQQQQELREFKEFLKDRMMI